MNIGSENHLTAGTNSCWLEWCCSHTTGQRFFSDFLRGLLGPTLAMRKFFLRASSSDSSQRQSLPLFSSSSKAPFPFDRSSLVRPSAIILGWGVQRKTPLERAIASQMIESSIDVLLSCLDDGSPFCTESNRLFASVIEHCRRCWWSLHCSLRTARKGHSCLDQSARSTSPCTTSRKRTETILPRSRTVRRPRSQQQSGRDLPTKFGWFSKDNTLTLVLCDAEGIVSEPKTIQAPCVRSSGGWPSGSGTGGSPPHPQHQRLRWRGTSHCQTCEGWSPV